VSENDRRGDEVKAAEAAAGAACCGMSESARASAGAACSGTTEAAHPAGGPACCGVPDGPSPERSRAKSACCGAPPVPPPDYPYGPAPYVVGTVQTPTGPVPQVTADISRADRLGTWRVRWGVGREDYRVRPGLYALGTPDEAAPVLVTANYKLTLDVLRDRLRGASMWVLVVDTRGINVWCAAGKGTFCAEEVARVVRESRLAEVVAHRRLILPQLAAPGVAAHRVKELCGFRVTFGPIRAEDIPAFLAADGKADPSMRTVTFTLGERMVLSPVELSVLWRRRMLLAYAAVIAASSVDGDGVSLRRGVRRGVPVIAAQGRAVLAGAAVTPALLPWLPGRAFSAKGAAAGAAAAGAAAVALRGKLSPAGKLALLAGVTTVSSFAAMNFTGSTPITSPSGVELEMRKALPLQAVGAALAATAWLATRMGR